MARCDKERNGLELMPLTLIQMMPCLVYKCRAMQSVSPLCPSEPIIIIRGPAQNDPPTCMRTPATPNKTILSPSLPLPPFSPCSTQAPRSPVALSCKKLPDVHLAAVLARELAQSVSIANLELALKPEARKAHTIRDCARA
jgi:hypothetical protein